MEWLIDHIENTKVNIELRGTFIRLLNYIYIDDLPHQLLKVSRAFKAFESCNQYIEHISSTRSDYLNTTNLNRIIHFIMAYIQAFAQKADGISYIKSFDMELVRLINYLLKFGLFIYRNNKFQIDDVNTIFSFLCHISDILTSRSYITKINSMDKIISKDTVHEDRSKMIPVERAAYDVKYYLFNKNFGNDHSNNLDELNDYKNKSSSKDFQYKLLREIVTIFHFFDDLRQHYLMSNTIEFFYRNVFSKFKLQENEVFSKEDVEKMNKVLLDEFIHLIPDSHAFHNHMSYELPSIDKMYEQNKFIQNHRSLDIENLAKAEMHDEFVTLLIDTFNEHSQDSFLRQLVMLLICRYNSERAEFIRNLDRTILFFNNNDFNFYRWTQGQLDKFVSFTEKSNIWQLKVRNALKNYADDLFEYGIIEDMGEIKATLNNLKRAIVYSCCIVENDEGTLGIEIKQGERNINVFAQDLYRNLKVYDYMLNFLFQNKELLLLVRSTKLEDLSQQQAELIKPIRRIFCKIFRVLEVMTVENPRTQELMWKYKEEFTLKELGDIEQEGELEFVLSVIDDSPESVKNNQNMWTLSKTR